MEFNRNGLGIAELDGFAVQDGTYTKEVNGEKFSFKRITHIDDLEATTPLQQAAFSLSEREVCPGHMLATLNKIGGLVVGVYNQNDELVSFAYNWPLMGNGEGKALLLDMIGVEEAVRDNGIGYETMKVTMLEAAKMGVEEIRFTYDPLKVRNANIYLRKIGAKVIEFEEDPYGSEGLSGDRFLASWDIGNPEQALARTLNRPVDLLLNEACQYPVITADNFPEGDIVLLPAPDNDELLSPEERTAWATLYRSVGRKYFPSYQATSFVSEQSGDSRHNFYILAKNN